MSTEFGTDEAMAEDQDMDGEGEYEGERYDEGDDELFDEEDVDEEAEAVAKRLGDALWADISKAYAQQGTAQPVKVPEASEFSGHPPSPRAPSLSMSEDGDDEETLTNAIQTVLHLAAGQPSLNEVLSGTIVPGSEDQTLLHVLTHVAGMKTVAPELADTLSDLVQSIADGQLFKISGKVLSSHTLHTLC